MDIEQAAKTIQWLDDERRKDKQELTALQERLAAVTGENASLTRRLQQLESERQQLEQENAQLRAEIAALRSVPRLIGAAQQLGYHQASADEVEYLVVRGVVPPSDTLFEEEVIVPEPENEDEIVAAYEETLESYLSIQLAGFRRGFAALWEGTFGTDPNAPQETPEPTRIP